MLAALCLPLVVVVAAAGRLLPVAVVLLLAVTVGLFLAFSVGRLFTAIAFDFFGGVDADIEGAAEMELPELMTGFLAGVLERRAEAVLLRVVGFLTLTFLPLPLC